jgi:hypothetical protein
MSKQNLCIIDNGISANNHQINKIITESLSYKSYRILEYVLDNYNNNILMVTTSPIIGMLQYKIVIGIDERQKTLIEKRLNNEQAKM